MRTVRVLLAFTLLLSMVAAGSGAAAAAAGSSSQDDSVIPGSWIVTLHEGSDPASAARGLARTHGGSIGHIYTHVLNGFSFKGSDLAAQALARNPMVRTVVADRRVSIVETVPTGIRRIRANHSSDLNAHTAGYKGKGINIAILDTGIDLDHDDLNVSTLGKNCIDSTKPPEDGNGHGTHVAGTAAAKLGNGLGVVGVAPEASVVPVKVLDDSGNGSWTSVICGINYVTANHGSIAVANMSLGGSGKATGCTDGDLHQAICESVAKGVVYTVAAGNSSKDAAGFVPAAYPEVITVSALADFDGQPGGNGGCVLFIGLGRQCDDDFAKFSNYGSIVDVIAPGVSIYSTYKGNSYSTMSGTSMAAPHVAGVVALVRAIDPSLTTLKVEELLRDSGECPNGVQNSGTGNCSNQGIWDNDPDGITEPLVHALWAATAAAGGGGSEPAATGTISGTVSGSDTNSGIVGATVTVQETGQSTTTGENGAYSIEFVEVGSSYTVTASAVGYEPSTQDNIGVSDGQTTTANFALWPAPDITLSATGYKVQGLQKADLAWGGASGNSVDIYRDGTKIVLATENDGAYTDNINKRGSGSYIYKVCEAGTSTCSNEARVDF